MRYIISQVGEFYEVFDTVDKVTVYATEYKLMAIDKLKEMNQ
jgi:hypothetical protein